MEKSWNINLLFENIHYQLFLYFFISFVLSQTCYWVVFENNINRQKIRKRPLTIVGTLILDIANVQNCDKTFRSRVIWTGNIKRKQLLKKNYVASCCTCNCFLPVLIARYSKKQNPDCCLSKIGYVCPMWHFSFPWITSHIRQYQAKLLIITKNLTNLN